MSPTKLMGAARDAALLAADTGSRSKAAAAASRAALCASRAARAASRAAGSGFRATRSTSAAASGLARSGAKTASRAAALAASRATSSGSASRANRDDDAPRLPVDAAGVQESGKPSDDPSETSNALDEGEGGDSAAASVGRYGNPHRACGFVAVNPRLPLLVVTKKDIATDEAIWALYEKWCAVFKNQDTDQVKRMFPLFKKTAVMTYGQPRGERNLGFCADGLEHSIKGEREKLVTLADEVDSDLLEALEFSIDYWEDLYKKLGVPTD